MEESVSLKIKLNGMEMTIQEFEMKKTEIESQSGMQLVEVAPREYRTRLLD